MRSTLLRLIAILLMVTMSAEVVGAADEFVAGNDDGSIGTATGSNMADTWTRLAQSESQVVLTLNDRSTLTGILVSISPEGLTLLEPASGTLRTVNLAQVTQVQTKHRWILWIGVTAVAIVSFLLVKNCFYRC